MGYSNLPCASSPLLSLLIGVAVAFSLLRALGTLLAVCGRARVGAGVQKHRAAPLPPCRPARIKASATLPSLAFSLLAAAVEPPSAGVHLLHRSSSGRIERA